MCPRPKKLWWIYFFGKRLLFQKWPSRGSEKIYTFIFQTSRTENRAKKGRFYGFSPFWAYFEGSNGTPKTLKINVSRLRKCHPHLASREHGTPRVFFDHSDPTTGVKWSPPSKNTVLGEGITFPDHAIADFRKKVRFPPEGWSRGGFPHFFSKIGQHGLER